MLRVCLTSITSATITTVVVQGQVLGWETGPVSLFGCPSKKTTTKTTLQTGLGETGWDLGWLCPPHSHDLAV